MVARRIRIGPSVQTIFDAGSLPGEVGDIPGYTMRNVIPVSGGNLGRVRVTFKGSPINSSLILDHASIGVRDAAEPEGDPAATLSTPNELLFSAASGFNIATGNTITSDWVTLTDTFTASDKLVVIIDIDAAAGSGQVGFSTGSAGVRYCRFKAADASYNLTTLPFGTSLGNNTYCVLSIETGP